MPGYQLKIVEQMLIALGPGQPLPAIKQSRDQIIIIILWMWLISIDQNMNSLVLFIFIFKVHQSYTVDNYCTTPVPHLSRQPSSLRHFGWTIKPFTQLDFCLFSKYGTKVAAISCTQNWPINETDYLGPKNLIFNRTNFVNVWLDCWKSLKVIKWFIC